jgi:hypothetical protein
VNEKTVALSIKGAKLTSRLLAKAMRAFLKKAREPTYKRGKQSIKSLAKQGVSLSNIGIHSSEIGRFKRTARRYNIDFALKRDDSKQPPNWIIFFKAKDETAIQAAFKEFSADMLKYTERKPSMFEKLKNIRETTRSAAPPVKNRNRGERER